MVRTSLPRKLTVPLPSMPGSGREIQGLLLPERSAR